MSYNPIMPTLPKIMGILNATPDSFSDGGRFNALELAKERIQQMIEEGAGIIDIGGESTGPGSKDVSTEEELARVKPIIDWVAESGFLDRAMFSIDTYKARVAEYALQSGFHVVNDVTALRGDPEIINVLLKYQPYVVLMYAKDPTPRTSSEAVEYKDVMATIIDFLQARADLLIQRGFPKEKIILDPGMGAFLSTNPKYSFEVIERLAELKTLGFPILVGVSRKGFLGGKLEDRDEASVEWSLKALQNGADVVRVHNVKMLKNLMTAQ